MVSKKKLQVTPSSWRGKKRYIAFQLLCDNKLSHGAVDEALWGTFLSLYGSEAVARQRLWLVIWNSQKNVGVARCALGELNRVKAGFLFFQRVGEKSVIPKLLTVSGSLKKVKQKLGVSGSR